MTSQQDTLILSRAAGPSRRIIAGSLALLPVQSECAQSIEIATDQRLLLRPAPPLQLPLGGNGVGDAVEVLMIYENDRRRFNVYPPKCPALCWPTRCSSSTRVLPM
jgi:hypothetical protein